VKFRHPGTCASLALVLAALLAGSGCSNNDGSEWQRLVCEVESVNAGAPLVSAYLNVGSDGIEGTTDDYLPIDIVPVVFHARPYSSTIMLPEDAPNSYFHVTHYDLEWVPGPTAPQELTQYNVERAPCEARVPVYEEAAVAILVADRGMKEEPWYLALYNDRAMSYQANARLTFYGHETGSDEEIEIDAGLQVTFYGTVSDQN